MGPQYFIVADLKAVSSVQFTSSNVRNIDRKFQDGNDYTVKFALYDTGKSLTKDVTVSQTHLIP